MKDGKDYYNGDGTEDRTLKSSFFGTKRRKTAVKGQGAKAVTEEQIINEEVIISDFAFGKF